jgi:glycopeptide antibiotics resistance protein
MKKILIILSIIAIVTTFDGYKGVVLAGDLCGGTGGNGEIVSVGINTFSLKLNKGSNLIVSLTSQATIETSSGPATLSDLKIGDRVTLVGDSHRDGTFTADTVVLCNATEVSGMGSTSLPQAGQANPITVRNGNSDAYEKVNGVINLVTILLVGLVWLGIVAFLQLKKRKSFVYLLFFTIFYIYLSKVLDYTLIQFQSLLLLKHFLPDLMLNGFRDGANVNLIPLATLTLEDVKTSLLNVLFMIPFGFGLPFVTNFRIKKVVIAGLLLSIIIEFLQLITGFIANTTFRVADINDLIFNTVGVAIGYMLFVVFVRIYRHVSRNWKMRANPILRYIAERPQVDNIDN